MDVFSIVLAVSFSGLASPSFDIRERTPIPPALAHFGLHHDDPEVRHRCERVVAGGRVAAIKKLIEARGKLPFIDALPGDFPDRCDIINNFLFLANETYRNEDGSFTIPVIAGDWPSYRIATELYLYTLGVEEARQVLEKMPQNAWWNGTAWQSTTPPPAP